MSFLIFFGLGLSSITWGLKSSEEIIQLSSAVIGAIFLVWGLCLTPQMLLVGAEIITLISMFMICIRCCECG